MNDPCWNSRPRIPIPLWHWLVASVDFAIAQGGRDNITALVLRRAAAVRTPRTCYEQ